MPSTDRPDYYEKLRDRADLFEERFASYFPVLIFGILAGAVQTAKKSTYPIATAELGAWGLLFIAGLAALVRLRILAHVHRSLAWYERRIKQLPGEYLASADPFTAGPALAIEAKLLWAKQERWMACENWLFRVAAALFILGIVALFCVRGAQLF